MIYYLIIEGRWLLTYLQTFFHTLIESELMVGPLGLRSLCFDFLWYWPKKQLYSLAIQAID